MLSPASRAEISFTLSPASRAEISFTLFRFAGCAGNGTRLE